VEDNDKDINQFEVMPLFTNPMNIKHIEKDFDNNLMPICEKVATEILYENYVSHFVLILVFIYMELNLSHISYLYMCLSHMSYMDLVFCSSCRVAIVLKTKLKTTVVIQTNLKMKSKMTLRTKFK
jgi:hypothetical protein